MRKFLIGFISLAVVLAVYLLYNRLSETLPVDTGPGTEFVEAVADSNMGGLDDEIGKIGEVGIGPVRKAKYVILNRDKEVEREFGFERLLHEIRDIWDIEKPYMNVYRHNFQCYITADRGKVQVETAVGKTTPKDATFTGNVVVRIVPEASSSIKESFVYLDEVIFLSERSQLSTGGPVKFVSEDAQMRGKGMELVYNEQTERLEYFRIIDLESLRLRTKRSQQTFLGSGKGRTDRPADTVSQAKTQQPAEPAVTGGSQKAEASLAPARQPTTQEQGEYYQCVLSKNVIIDSPEQFVFADEEICINDIFWSKASSSRSGQVDAGGPDDTPKIVEAGSQVPQSADKSKAQKVTVSPQSEPNEPSVQFIDIVVTCDNGVLVVPMDSPRVIDHSVKDVIEATASDAVPLGVLDDDTERTQFFTQRIDYNAATGDAVATGLSELRFYASPVFKTQRKTQTDASDATAAEANEAPVAVKVVAREGATYLQAPNQVIFEGDCLCTMPQTGFSEPQNATFSAPKITVNVPKEKSEQPDIFAAGPAELVFYMEDSNDAGTEKKPVPVRINAQRQARFLPASNQIVFEGDCLCTMPQKGLTPQQNCTFSSPQLTIELPKDKAEQPDIFAAGPAELTFFAQPALQEKQGTETDVNDLTVKETKRAPLPAKATAQKQVRFLAASNQVIFEGDCRCTMVQEDPNALVKYMLSAEQIAVDFPEDTNDRAPGSTIDIEHLTASGGTVKLSTISKAGQKLLGGIELECHKCEYDAEQQLFLATGPGVINFNNAEASEPNAPAGKFSLRKPCWAFLRDFETLKYFLRENRIVADAGSQRLLIDYFPVIDGQYDEHFKAIASHVEALLTETAEGQTELSTLIASGGIDYEDDDNQFIGSQLFYDHEKSLMKVSGNASQPCYLNGALVDAIEYDLKTRKVEFEIPVPGALQTPR